MFSGKDEKLTSMLRSGDVQKVADAVNEILNREVYGLPESKWSKRASTGKLYEMPGVLGIKKYKCDIIIREDERFDIETFIHENLHSRSVSLYPEKDRKNVYESNRRIEEGTIEFLAQEICNKSNVPFIGSYDDYVEALRDIKRIIAPMQNDYDFGRSLIEIPLHERYNHLKKSVEIYKQSRSRIRKIVIERLDEDLANLFGGD